MARVLFYSATFSDCTKVKVTKGLEPKDSHDYLSFSSLLLGECQAPSLTLQAVLFFTQD